MGESRFEIDPGGVSATTVDQGESRIWRVLVVGAGTMGSGIAQVVAEAGIDVRLSDTEGEALNRGLAGIERRWQQSIERGHHTADQVGSFAAHLRPGDITDAAEADLVIEAVVENLGVKSDLFRELAAVAPSETIFASNTSSLSITALGQQSGRPERFVGLHFFNPVPRLPLVEIVRGLGTTEETVRATRDFAQRLGKTPVIVNDAPGFVANRILLPMINEAIFSLQDGVADRDTIDTVMRLGASHPNWTAGPGRFDRSRRLPCDHGLTPSRVWG